MPGALPAHVGQGSSRDIDDTQQIDVDLPPHLRIRQLFDGADVAVSGVVVYDIQPTEMRDAAFHGVARRFGVGHVQAQGQGTVAKTMHETSDGVRLEARRGHTPTALEYGERRRPTESTRCSGNEPDFPGCRYSICLHDNSSAVCRIQNMPYSLGDSFGIS